MCGEKLQLSDMPYLTFGITPACAGKSSTALEMTGVIWDHPRVCGEKAAMMVLAMRSSGSPPRVRGKDPLAGDAPRLAGITPACAGKRGSTSPTARGCRDHPRVCGEKSWVPFPIWPA